MKKLLAATVFATTLGMTTFGASAAPIYIDLDGAGGEAASASFEGMTVNYNSFTEVNTNTKAIITRAGQELVGYTFDSYAEDRTDLELADDTRVESNNSASIGHYFATDSFLTFGLELEGVLDDSGINYSSGSLDLYLASGFFGATSVNPVSILSADFGFDALPQGEQIVVALIEGTASVQADTFFFEQNNLDFSDALVAVGSQIEALISQTVSLSDLNNSIANPLATDGAGTVLISGDHTADISFEVPEPASIAAFGLGLLGLAGVARRRK